jgi:hypothetical protein
MSTIVLEGGPAWLFLLARLIEIAVVILLTVFWCSSMERALRACDPSSRKMALGQSWLIFIPLFGFVWQFIAVNKVSLSLATEYHLRGWKSDEGRPGIETGLIACVVVVVVFLLRSILIDLNPGVAVLTSLAICICMYMHRERLIAFTERLEAERRKSQQSFSFDSGPNPFAQANFFPQSQANPFPQYNQQPAMPNPFQPAAYPNAPAPGYAPNSYTPVDQYSSQQYVQQLAHQHAQQQQQQRQQQEQRAPGWDGMTTWEAPEGWKHPDLSDPRPYFS